MKRLALILSLVVGITMVLSGCSSSKNKYTKKEDSINDNFRRYILI